MPGVPVDCQVPDHGAKVGFSSLCQPLQHQVLCSCAVEGLSGPCRRHSTKALNIQQECQMCRCPA